MLYTSKDVERLLGIKADQLSYYVRTKKLFVPDEVGVGRGKSNKYSLYDLYKLALIKKLSKYGIELNFTKSYLDKFLKTKSDQSIFELFKQPKVAKAGMVAIVFFEPKLFTVILCDTRENIAKEILKPNSSMDFILIDLGSIIRDIEKSTGEEF